MFLPWPLLLRPLLAMVVAVGAVALGLASLPSHDVMVSSICRLRPLDAVLCCAVLYTGVGCMFTMVELGPGAG